MIEFDFLIGLEIQRFSGFLVLLFMLIMLVLPKGDYSSFSKLDYE